MSPDDPPDPPPADRATNQDSARVDGGHPTPQVRVRPAVVARTLSAVGGIVATVGGILALVGLLVAIGRVLFAYEPLIGIGLAVLVGGAILLAAGELVRETADRDAVDGRLDS